MCVKILWAGTLIHTWIIVSVYLCASRLTLELGSDEISPVKYMGK